MGDHRGMQANRVRRTGHQVLGRIVDLAGATHGRWPYGSPWAVRMNGRPPGRERGTGQSGKSSATHRPQDLGTGSEFGRCDARLAGTKDTGRVLAGATHGWQDPGADDARDPKRPGRSLGIEIHLQLSCYCLFSNQAQHCAAKFGEVRIGFRVEQGTRARQIDRDLGTDAAGAGGHHVDAI